MRTRPIRPNTMHNQPRHLARTLKLYSVKSGGSRFSFQCSEVEGGRACGGLAASGWNIGVSRNRTGFRVDYTVKAAKGL